MAKKRKSHKTPVADARKKKDETGAGTEKYDRQRTRALILSALTAGGAFQMNSWQVQAHGNRSTHSVLAAPAPFFAPSDFVLQRDHAAGSPNPNANQITDLSTRIATLTAQGQGSTSTAIALRKQRSDLLESVSAVRPETRRVLDFLRSGDTAAAVAGIEGEGFTERVLSRYEWTLLELGSLGRDDAGSSTGTDMKEFAALAGPAFDYGQRIMALMNSSNKNDVIEEGTKARIAELYHNIASFMILPSKDPLSNQDLELGRRAADVALKIRMDLKQVPETMRAQWMVAQYDLKANNLRKAATILNAALKTAERTKDTAGVAWTKYSLAQALKSNNPKLAQKYAADARQIVASYAPGKDTTIEFLRLEMAKQTTQ